MSIPQCQAFVDALPAELGINLYPGLANVVDGPAVLMRPDQPWLEREAYEHELERYVAIAIVAAATPDEAMEQLHVLVHAIVANCDRVPGWSWDTVGRIVADESTGVPFLVAAVRLTYRDCTEGS